MLVYGYRWYLQYFHKADSHVISSKHTVVLYTHHVGCSYHRKHRIPAPHAWSEYLWDRISYIIYCMWVPLITAFQCRAVTSLCKISCLYFICTRADLLSQRKHCISRTSVSLPSGVSQAWTRMNTNINCLSLHPCFIPICPLCTPLIPFCLLPLTSLSCSPLIIHIYIPCQGRKKKDWILVGSITRQQGVLLGDVLLFHYEKGQEVVCIWVVKQNNKPSSCQVNWSRISRLSIRSTNKCTLSTPTHYIEWT